jgi:hypothetical protein
MAAPSSNSALAAKSANDIPLSPAELNLLAAGSPDVLIPNAPVEPGDKMNFPSHDPTVPDIGNFGRLDPTLWRGSRLGPVGHARLLTLGVKTIINVENDMAAVNDEKAWAAENHVNFISMPMSTIIPPGMGKIDQFLQLAEDPANRPLYFHCKGGRDRTGTLAFCYRVRHDGWRFSKANAELIAYHFHQEFLTLRVVQLFFDAFGGYDVMGKFI